MGRIILLVIWAVGAWIAPKVAAVPSPKGFEDPVTCARYVGLFVGITDYAYLPDRPDARVAAGTLYDLFRSVPGAEENVLLLDERANHSAVTDALQRLRDLDRDECAVLYFAGHGFTMDTELDAQVGFLLLADSRKNQPRPEAAISMRYLRQLFSSSEAGGILMLLDAGVGGLQGDVFRSSSDDSSSAQSRLVIAGGGRGSYGIRFGAMSPFARAVIAGLSGAVSEAGSPISLATAGQLAEFVGRAISSSDDPPQFPSFRTLLEGGRDMALPRLPIHPTVRIDLGAASPSERPQARISVVATPESATVLIDGASIGRGSVSANVPSGEATIEVVLAGHATWIRRVHLMPGESRAFTAEPVLAEAYVQFVNLPVGAELRMGDGQDLPANVVHHVPTGPTHILVQMPARGKMKVDLDLQPGEIGLVKFQQDVFSPGVVMRSMILPGWGQFHAGAYGEGIVAGVVVGGLVLFGSRAEVLYDASEEAYRSAEVSYRRSETGAAAEKARVEMVASYEDARRANRLRKMAWSAVAAAYGGNLLDALLRHAFVPQLLVTKGPSTITMNPRLDTSSEGMAFGVDIRF